MKDSELLGLLDRAQERQRGEKGEPGTGIDRIEQFDDESFTIKLTTGESRKISLPIAKDGEVGPTGSVGPRGPEGAAGKPGRDGASATDGQPGPQGLPGVSLSTAVVNDSGELLLQLSDGVIINVGRVRGPAGATGGQGATGLPGNPGRDGKQMLSGPRTPTQDDGEEGDHWIDVSDTSFALFKKDGGGWSKIADLRQIVQPRAVSAPGGGGGGGAGGGKGEPQNTRTLPLFNPTGTRKSIPATLPDPGALLTQEDANKYLLRAVQNAMVFVGEFPPNPAVTTEGQLWWCTADDDLTLYIFTGTEWVAASPPVSLDGVQSAIASIDEQLLKVNANVAMNKSELDEKALDIQLDQDRQDEEIRSLKEQVEGIQEEFDRGKWTHVTKKPSVGQYALGVKLSREYCEDQYMKCLAEADSDPIAVAECNRIASECETAKDNGESTYAGSWGGVDHISIHTEEADGEIHGFADYTAGKYIEIINEGDEGNATYQITEDAVIADGIAVIAVSDIQHTGKPSGLGRFKVFEMKSSDPTDYLKRTGGTMTGRLTLKRPHDDSNNNSLRIYGRVGGKVDQILFKDYQRKLPTDGSTPKDDYVEYHGPCDGAKSIANRDQIKQLIQEYATPKPTPTPFTWTLEEHSSANPSQGCMAWEKGKFIVLNQTTFEGVRLLQPKHLPSGANVFASYMVPSYTVPSPNEAKNMQIWMEHSANQWELMAWMTPYKYRFWYKGWVQLEYKNMEGSMPDEYGKRFGVTLPELF